MDMTTIQEATPVERAKSYYQGLKNEYDHVKGLVEHVVGEVKTATEQRVKDIEAELARIETELGIKPGTHVKEVAAPAAKTATAPTA